MRALCSSFLLMFQVWSSGPRTPEFVEMEIHGRLLSLLGVGVGLLAFKNLCPGTATYEVRAHG